MKNTVEKSTRLIALCFLITLWVTPSFATRYYVATTGNYNNNGLSWLSPNFDLERMLARCTEGDEVWVAKGTYTPYADANGVNVTPSNYFDATFYIPKGVRVYGGFVGNETALSQRNIAANPTIFQSENASKMLCHVVILQENGVLDGLTIKNGSSNGQSGSVTIRDSIVSRIRGAGVYGIKGGNTIRYCTIRDNLAYYGAGIYLAQGYNTLVGNQIVNNSAFFSGGGLHSEKGGLTLTNNLFHQNSVVSSFGGAVYLNIGSTDCTSNGFVNNTFSYNSAPNGGGLYFVDNSTTSCPFNLDNNIFWENTRTGGNIVGADYYNTRSTTFFASMDNNLFQLNANQYSAASNNYVAGNDNIFNQNPQFLNPTDADGADNLIPTADDGLSIKITSPARNAGTNTGAPTTDITGITRFNTTDIGAYEHACNGAANVYVDGSISTSGDGSTWATAFKTIGEALVIAYTCTANITINVAAGTYKPTTKFFNNGTETTTSDPRDVTFYLRQGMTLKGGYPSGGGTRNPSANITLLSGDIGTPNVTTDNAYHVVVLATAGTGTGATIDGFSIANGNGNGTASLTQNSQTVYQYNGGGVYLINGNHTLENNRFYDNYALYGGGLFLQNGTNRIVNNTFNNNTATEGAGISFTSGTNTVSKNTFYGNNAVNTGGAMSMTLGTHNLTNNVLYNNTSNRGGGIATNQMTASLFYNNTLYNNTAAVEGGGLYAVASTLNLTNNLFWENKKGANSGVAQADLLNLGSTLTCTKNLWQLAQSAYTAGTNNSLGTASGNVFAQNPSFINENDPDGVDNIARTADDGLHLGLNSPAQNTGATGTTTEDSKGATRTGIPDIGAYERTDCSTPSVIYVDSSRPSSGNGTTWATAYRTLGEALIVSNYCPAAVTIRMAAGTYLPTTKPFENGSEITSADARELTFHLPDNVTLEGGYPAGGGTRNVAANPTILSGDIGTLNDAADNAYHVVLAMPKMAFATGINIDGVSVINGAATGFGNTTVNGNTVFKSKGAGIYAFHGTKTFNNVTVSNNNASADGGGLHLFNGTHTFTNMTINNNSAFNEGGGLYIFNGTNTFTNTSIYANSSSYDGGGLQLFNGSNTFTRTTIFDNTARNSGGAIFANSSPLTMTSNVLYGNNATAEGGAIYADFGAITLMNNTFYNNSTNTNGGGMYLNRATPTVRNTIFWDNKTLGANNVAGADVFTTVSSGSFSNNLLQLAQANYSIGTNNDLGTASNNLFNQNPLFVNAADPDGADNLHRTRDDGLGILAASPVRNVGTATGAPSVDITNTARLGLPDMGAYESGCVSNATFYVDGSKAVNGDGLAWTTALNTLDEALLTACLCPSVTTVRVAAGTYLTTKKPYDLTTSAELTTADNRDKTFFIRSGLTLEGGYPVGGGTRNVATNATILSGNLGNPNDVGDNAYHVVLGVAALPSSAGFTLDGFTIKDGYANTYSDLSVNGNNTASYYGGGIYAVNGNNTFVNNTITNNYSDYAGGGFYSFNSSNTFNNNKVQNNSGFIGVGVNMYGGTSTLNDNIISNNRGAFGDAGGGYFQDATIALNRNFIHNNWGEDGTGGIGMKNCTSQLNNNVIHTNEGAGCGGIYMELGTCTLTNNLIFNNTSFNAGGIYVTLNSAITLTNNTLYNNAGGSNNSGGASIYGTGTLNNNIFWGNTFSGANNVAGADFVGNLAVTNNNLFQLSANNYVNFNGNTLGTSTANLFATTPRFVNATDPDGADNIFGTADDGLRLDCGSLAINRGRNTDAPTLDFAGSAIFSTTKDIGAYERQAVAPCSIYTTTTDCEPFNTATLPNNIWSEYYSASGGIMASFNPLSNNLTNVLVKITTIGTSVTEGGVPRVGRTISVTTTGAQPTSDYLLRLYFKNSELANFNATNGTSLTKNNLDILHKSTGSGCSFAGYTDAYARVAKANVTAVDLLDGFYLEFRLNHFTLFSAAATSSPLPIELLAFQGKNTEGGNLLTWQTAEEKNVSNFDIERSRDGRFFEKIGSVKSKGSNSNYTFLDDKTSARFETSPTLGLMYYRLKINDLDGKTAYSKIISIQSKGQSGIRIYPSMATDFVTIEGATSVQIINASGQTVLSQDIKDQFNLSINHLPNGFYIIKAKNRGGGVFSEKIMKQ